jgi:hypothetical protein
MLDEEEAMPETKAAGEARRFLANEDLTFAQANALCEQLKCLAMLAGDQETLGILAFGPRASSAT